MQVPRNASSLNMILCLIAGLGLASFAASAAPTFEDDVEPIFAKKCAGCHYPAAGKVKGGLDLSTAAATLAGGESGAAIVVGDAAASLLVQSVEHRAEPFMPPPAKFPKLADAEIAAIRAWIDAGAASDTAAAPAAPAPLVDSASERPAPISAMAFSPHGDLIARGSMGSVELLKIGADATDAERVALLEGHADAVRALAFSADGTLLAAAGGAPGRAGELKIWRMADRVLLHSIAAHADSVLGVAFGPDGQRVATCSYDRLAKVWDVATGAEVFKLADHVDAINAIAYSPDGKTLATGASDRTVKLWDAATGERQITLSDSTDAVLSLVISPDSRYLAAGAADKRIRVWDLVESGNRFMQSGLTSGVLKQSTFAHEGGVLRLCYAPDGATLYSASEDRRIKAWDTAAMTEKLLFEDQPDWVLAMALAPDGKTLAVGRYDASSALLDTTTGKALLRASGGGALAKAEVPSAAPTKPRDVNVDLIEVQATIPPSLQSFSPVRQARGTTFEATVNGMNLEGARPYFDDVRIAVEIVKSEALPRPEVKRDPNSLGAQIFDNATPYRLTLKVTLPADLAPGGKFLFCQTPLGLSEPTMLVVLPSADLGEAEPNNTTDVAQPLAWPAVVAGVTNTEGDVDRYKVTVAADQELVCILKDVAPNFLLTLRDATGKALATSDDFGTETESRLGYHFAQAGDYVVEVTHKDFRRDLGYRLHVGDYPWAYAVSPLGISAGAPQRVAVKGFNLGGASELDVDPPDAAFPWDTVALPISTYADNPVPSVRLAVAELPSQREAEPNDAPASAQPIAARQAIDATLDAGDTADQDCYRVALKQGEQVLLDVLASRVGSPVDSIVDVLSAEGHLLQRAQARCVGQTFITLNDRDSVASGIRIDNWSDMAINDYVMSGNEIMRVKRLPGSADEDIALYDYRGKRLGFFGTSPEFHAVNAPVYKVELRGVDEVLTPNGMPVVPIYWTNDDAVFEDERRGDSQLVFESPADGDYIVRVRDAAGGHGTQFAYRLMLRERQPAFDFSAGPYRNNITPGGSVPLDLRVRRRDGFDAPVKVEFKELPPGFSIPEAIVPGDMEDLRVVLSATPDAKSTEPYVHYKVVATAMVDGPAMVRESGIGSINVVAQVPDIKVNLDREELALRPGETQTIQVRLDRSNGFNSRVPIDLLNLPFGVRVLDSGLNGILVREGEFERAVRIYCEPWVKPMDLRLYVQARIEARAPGRMLFASPPFQLRVLPQAEAKVAAATP